MPLELDYWGSEDMQSERGFVDVEAAVAVVAAAIAIEGIKIIHIHIKLPNIY